MEMETSEDWEYTGTEDEHIPIDLFCSKEDARVPRGTLEFTNASGNMVFKVQHQPPNPKLLLDSNDNPLFSIHRRHNGTWKCYKGNGDENKELVLKVKRTLKTISRVKLKVFFAGERLNKGVCDLKVIGSPFMRSCSISKDGDLVAQSSLMYNLIERYPSRDKFRLTIFPGIIDHSLIVALFVIFLKGRK